MTPFIVSDAASVSDTASKTREMPGASAARRPDTVDVSRRQQVKAGDPLVDIDIDQITRAGYSIVTPVVITNASSVGQVQALDQKAVMAGDPLLIVKLNAESAAAV